MNNYLTRTNILNQNKKSILKTTFLNHFKKTNEVKVMETLLWKKSL